MWPLFLATALVALVPDVGRAQPIGTLRITLTLDDVGGVSGGVPRHALLISDNPPTSAPRRVVTAADGTATVRLRPGNYTVESEEPLVIGGKGLSWTVMVDISEGRESVVSLATVNAEVGEVTVWPVGTSAPPPRADDPRAVLPTWQDAVVAVWTPTHRASGFVVSATGLVVTSAHVVNGVSSARVQFAPALTVTAPVLAADRDKDVAVLWVDATVLQAAKVLSIDCGVGSRRALGVDERVAALGVPLRGPKEVALADISRDDRHEPIGDFRLSFGSVGGPVFRRTGELAGLTSPLADGDDLRGRDARIVPIEQACDVLRSAEAAMATTPRPSAAALAVVEPPAVPVAALDAAIKGRTAELAGYRATSADFDLTFLTPVVVHARRVEQESKARSALASPRAGAEAIDVTDFGAWSPYFEDRPAVLTIRVTPRLTEGFWTKIARGAAYTQGMALPPIKRFRPGFARLRAFCGDTEVQPLHAFVLEQRVTESDAIREGLVVFEAGALGPTCGRVRLELYSEKAPDKADTRVADPAVIERVANELAPFRTATRGTGAARGSMAP